MRWFSLLLMVLAAAASPATLATPAEALARIDGLWCGTGLLRGSSMRLARHAQEFDGLLLHRGRERPLQGRIDGDLLLAQSSRYGPLAFKVDGNEIRLASAEGMLALAQGTTFQRADADRCTP